MGYKQIERIMDSYNLHKEEKSHGIDYQIRIGKKHRIILERIKPLKNGGVGGFLFVKVLDDFREICSINGHVCIGNISSEIEVRNLVERLIRYFEKEFA